MEFDNIKERLEKFFENNSKSTLEKIQLNGNEVFAIVSPWGDTSLAIEIGEDCDQLLESLPNLIFPERLSAIYHIDQQELEIAWTTYKLPPSVQEVHGRAFEFRYRDKSYQCEFSKCSDALLQVAGAFSPVGPSDMGYRNLPSFRRYAEAGKDAVNSAIFGIPSSFWIRDIALPEDDLIAFLTHLNFYLSYFDDASPIVIIHPPQIAKSTTALKTRYRHNKFPASISSRQIDPELLQFWAATQSGDPARRFLYSYRIVEHAAFAFVESAPKLAVRKVLMSPHALDDIGEATERVIAAVKSSKIDEYQKIEQLTINCVDPNVLWRVVEQNIDFFASSQKFDGGFEIQSLIAGKDSEREFINSGIKNFCNQVRKIRNALSHGREERSASVITPTKGNYEKLRPWASLMTRAAGEVILFQNAQ